MSLVEVMVMSGVAIVAGSALLSMNLNISRLQKQIETRGEMAAWKTLAGQYLLRADSGVCEAFIKKVAPDEGNRALPTEAELCQQLRKPNGDQACSSLEVALGIGATEGCSIDPKAEKADQCPEVFMSQAYPNLAQLPPPPGFSGQSMRLAFPKMVRGPGYTETKPEYVIPLQLAIERTEPRQEVQFVEPGLVTLRLKGGKESDARVIESCSLGVVASAVESPQENFKCLPGQILTGFEEGEPLCAPQEPCKAGQQLVLLAGDTGENGVLEPETWGCAEPPVDPEKLDEGGLVSLCMGDCS